MKEKINLKNIKINNKDIVLCKKNIKFNTIAIVWKDSNEVVIYNAYTGNKFYKNKWSSHKVAIRLLENDSLYKDYKNIN